MREAAELDQARARKVADEEVDEVWKADVVARHVRVGLGELAIGHDDDRYGRNCAALECTGCSLGKRST